MLTTLAAVKLHLGITDTSDDALLTQFIAQASDDIAARCNRTLTREMRTDEKYRRDIGVFLYLDLYPVESVDSVTVDGVAITDYELYGPAGRLYRAAGWGNETLVTYTGGYNLTEITGPPIVPRTLPSNLEFAAILWVACAYNSRGSEHLSDEGIGPLKSVFWAEQPTIKAVIEKFRRVSV